MPNQRFDQRLKDLPPEIWNNLSRIDELKGQWIGLGRTTRYRLIQRD